MDRRCAGGAARAIARAASQGCAVSRPCRLRARCGSTGCAGCIFHRGSANVSGQPLAGSSGMNGAGTRLRRCSDVQTELRRLSQRTCIVLELLEPRNAGSWGSAPAPVESGRERPLPTTTTTPPMSQPRRTADSSSSRYSEPLSTSLPLPRRAAIEDRSSAPAEGPSPPAHCVPAVPPAARPCLRRAPSHSAHTGSSQQLRPAPGAPDLRIVPSTHRLLGFGGTWGVPLATAAPHRDARARARPARRPDALPLRCCRTG